MARSKSTALVSETTRNQTKLSETELTPEGFSPDSEEYKALTQQRDFLSQVAKPSFVVSANARRKYDQEWLARNLFWRGYQFSKYMPNTQTVVLTSRQSARFPINYMASMLRAIRNQVTSFRPKWEVMPEHPTIESSKVQARYSQSLLDFYFDHLKLKKKIKETITQGLLYSIGGPWQVVYDPISKEVKIWLLDPFDFYMDPIAEEYEESAFMIKAVRRPLAEVIHNPNYNIWARKEINAGDSKLAASEYKQFMIQSLKMVSSRSPEDSPEVILYEGDFRRYHEDGTPYLVKCIWTDSNMTPLSFEELEDPDYDYVIYQGDINPKDIYGESWAKHVMPLNRALNSLETSAFEYNYRVAKGRIVIDRDSGIRAIHNVHGEVISKNRGSTVESLDMAPLPVAVPQQIERIWRYMEDVSGIHEASLGRIPTGVKTGVGIAELKQSDATSQDDLVDNLEDFLSQVGQKLLKKIAKNYSNFKVIKDLGIREGDEKYFVAIGKDSAKGKLKDARTTKTGTKQVKIGPDWLDVAEIGDENAIRVTVGSWLGYTKEALQQKVTGMFQMQLIDQATALKLMEFGDIDTIIQQTRVEGILKKAMTQPAQPGQPDQLSLADTENAMMLEGKAMPVSELDDHMVHIAVHQDALGQGMDEIVGQHIQKHQIYLGHTPVIPTAGGTDFADQARAGAVAAQNGTSLPAGVPGATPPGTPGVSNAAGPMGAPSGQNLPQQNIPQALTQTNNQAAAAIAPQ